MTVDSFVTVVSPTCPWCGLPMRDPATHGKVEYDAATGGANVRCSETLTIVQPAKALRMDGVTA